MLPLTLINRIFACGVLFCATSFTCRADMMMLWQVELLQQVKSKMESSDTEIQQALDAIVARAKLALSRGPYSVTDKTDFPEDRDIHDYYSQGPYWWPDPEQPDGLPYIRKDGEVNPEKYSDALDSNRRHDMTEDVVALTLAGFFTRDDRYLDHAANQIRTWFTEPGTAMNPNMSYAQSIPGRSTGRATGIIDSRSFIYVVESALVLHSLGVLNEQEMERLRAWFGQFSIWLKTSVNGIKEGRAKNNHGTFYDLQLGVFSWFSGDLQTAREVVSHFCEKRVKPQIGSDGRMSHELARTRPFHYSVFNLKAMVNMALLAERVGAPLLLQGCTEDYRVKLAVEYLVDLSSEGRDWPEQPTAPEYQSVFELLLMMHRLTGDKQYLDKAAETNHAFRQSVVHLLLPPQTSR